MRTLLACVLLLLTLQTSAKESAAPGEGPPQAGRTPSGGSAARFGGVHNPNIDSGAYLRLANQAMTHREARRVSEDEFIRLARQPGVFVLDARSRVKYDALHVKGAINVNFADITVDSLNALLPDKSATILIYCNNNFADAPDPMPVKMIAAALNLATYTSLYTYGYRNVYELGPYLSVMTTRIPFEGTYAETIRFR
jgi:phage shock protein E